MLGSKCVDMRKEGGPFAFESQNLDGSYES